LNLNGAGGGDSYAINSAPSAVGTLNLSGGDGPDSFAVHSATFNTAVVVNGESGNDDATFGNGASPVSATSLRFNGGAGDDAIAVSGNSGAALPVFDGGGGNDTATYLADGSATAMTVGSSSVRQSFSGGLDFSNAEHVVISGTSADETINLTTSLNGPAVAVIGRTGNDVLNVTLQVSPPTVNPAFDLGPGNDQLNLLGGEMISPPTGTPAAAA
jgi:hypothetical protein